MGTWRLTAVRNIHVANSISPLSLPFFSETPGTDKKKHGNFRNSHRGPHPPMLFVQKNPSPRLSLSRSSHGTGDIIAAASCPFTPLCSGSNLLCPARQGGHNIRGWCDCAGGWDDSGRRHIGVARKDAGGGISDPHRSR